VRVSPTDGQHVVVELDNEFNDNVGLWFGPPNSPGSTGSGIVSDMVESRSSGGYDVKFTSPNVTASRSLYLRFEGSQPLAVTRCVFLDYYDREV
jgi:hypothetical protein